MKIKTHILRNAGLSIILLMLFLISPQLSNSAESVKSVEGLFYLDGTPVSIEIKDGKIDKIIRTSDISEKNNSKMYVAPGFIDNQVNGYVTVAFAGEGLTVEGIKKATQALWKAGVTTYLPTLTTNSHELLLNNFKVLAQALKDPDIALSIPGYHLEGPYISPVDGYRGAHLKQWVRKPDWNEFMQFYEAADEKILQVSLAPEIEGAFDFIRNCRSKGILVALAHHNGSADIIKQAIDEGAVIATHLGNGCANEIHRHNNPLWPQLADDRLMASIIVDGFHLRPEEVQVFFKVKGPERILLTSDVTSLAGMPPGEYTTRGRTVVLTPDGKIELPAQNVLAGAASPITKSVGNVMRFTNCSLADAVHMASRNQARLFQLHDRGEILPGKRADLVLFTLENNVVNIKKVIINGKLVVSL